MSIFLHSRVIFGLLSVGVVSVTLVALSQKPTATPDNGEGSGDLGLSNSSGSFTIQGLITESISPGLKVPLDLKLTNPNASAMVIKNLRVTVKVVQAPNADRAHPCTPKDFTTGTASRRPHITIAAESTSTLSNLGIPSGSWPFVGMLNRPVDQDGCKGASLTLAYAASGTVTR